MDAPQLPLWWSWLSWPTTLLTGAVGSALYLYMASIGLDFGRRIVLAVSGASVPVAVGGLLFATASNICADGAHLRVDFWVPPVGVLVWFAAVVGLGAVARVPAPYAWAGPLLGLVAAAVAVLAESIVGLHTMSRYCERLPGPLRIHTIVAVAMPAVVLGVAGAVARMRN